MFDNAMTNTMLEAIARWLVTAAAAWLVAHGVEVSGSTETALAGGLVGLLTVAWSWWQHWRLARATAKKVDLALAMPAGATTADLNAAELKAVSK